MTRGVSSTGLRRGKPWGISISAGSWRPCLGQLTGLNHRPAIRDGRAKSQKEKTTCLNKRPNSHNYLATMTVGARVVAVQSTGRQSRSTRRRPVQRQLAMRRSGLATRGYAPPAAPRGPRVPHPFQIIRDHFDSSLAIPRGGYAELVAWQKGAGVASVDQQCELAGLQSLRRPHPGYYQKCPGPDRVFAHHLRV